MSNNPIKAPAVAAEIIFVDLDETLIATDLVWESLLLAIRNQPLLVFQIPFWLMRGRPYLKRQIARRAVPKAVHLPYRREVLDFLDERRQAGAQLVLATASDRLTAQGVVDHLGIFSDTIATEGGENVKGAKKLARIEQYCQQHGYSEFSYIGDAWADLPIWKHSKYAYMVAPSAPLIAAVERGGGGEARVLVRRRPLLRPMLRALRPHQWVKNVLLAVPLVLAHKFFDWHLWLLLSIALVAMSACASAVYLINDMLDLEADRKHPTKRHRPMASGALPVTWGPPLVLGFVALAFGLSLAFLPVDFTGLLAFYLVLNTGYSAWLKRKPIIDVLTLAGMYTLRVLAGGLAVDVPVSEWLLAFSTFFFVSLAFAKRYSELQRMIETQQRGAAGRGYRVTDAALIQTMGSCSGYLAVLVLALYINSPQSELLYNNRTPLWGICMLLLYWISRLWFWAGRGEVLEDPIVFAFTDRVSLIIGIISVALVLATAW